LHRDHGFLLTPMTTDVENNKNRIGRGYLDPVFVSESGMTHLRELRVEDDSYRMRTREQELGFGITHPSLFRCR